MSRWPLQTTYFWQEAPLFRPFIFLVGGIICYDRGWVSSQYFIPATVLLAVTGLCSAISGLRRLRTAWLDVLYAVSFSLFFTILGWCMYATSPGGTSVSGTTDSSSLSLVRITAAPQERAVTTKLLVQRIAQIGDDCQGAVNGAALVYVYGGQGVVPFAAGDTVLLPSRWQNIRNSGNPFELNNVALQRRRGIRQQQVLSADDIVLFGKGNVKEAGLLINLYGWCDKQLRAYIHDSATLGLLQAMLLGDERGFDPELRQAYSQTGVIHIVSISGSHVGVLYLVVTGVLFWLRGRRGNWVKFLAGFVLVWLYVLIAGGPPSALRAALMFSVLTLCTLIERDKNMLNIVVCAAFALLLYQPAWLFSVGFQLSFGAVLSILIFYRPIYGLWSWPFRSRITKVAWQAVAASLAAEILTAPLVIYYFHNFPLFFLFANLLAALLAGMCALIGGMAIIALCWIPSLAEIIASVVTLCVKLFNGGITWMQERNVAALEHLQVSGVELLVIYLLVVALGIAWLQKHRAAMVAALSISCLLMILLSYDHYEALRQERLIVYNNGRLPAVEVLRGIQYFTIAGIESAYSVGAAHTGYHAWQNAPDTNRASYFAFKGKNILVLADSTVQSYSQALPVDVLILARSLRLMRVGEMISAFAPKEVVIGTRPSAYHLKRWRDSCSIHGIRVHNVAEDGAYIIE